MTRGSGLATAACRIVGADLDDRSAQAFCVGCEYRASFGAKPICEVALPEMELRSSLLGHLADLQAAINENEATPLRELET